MCNFGAQRAVSRLNNLGKSPTPASSHVHRGGVALTEYHSAEADAREIMHNVPSFILNLGPSLGWALYTLVLHSRSFRHVINTELLSSRSRPQKRQQKSKTPATHRIGIKMISMQRNKKNKRPRLRRLPAFFYSSVPIRTCSVYPFMQSCPTCPRRCPPAQRSCGSGRDGADRCRMASAGLA